MLQAMKRVLVPYFPAGNGHLMFAKSFAHELAELRPDWEIRLFDAAGELPDHGLRRLFVDHWKTILAMPDLVKNAIFALEPLQGGISEAVTKRIIAQSRADAQDVLADWRPDLVLPTHWGCGHLFAEARRGLPAADRPPIWAVYTEFGRAYRLVNCQADRYYALSERSARDLERVGVDPAAIRRMALFVPPDLAGGLPAPAEARRALDLDPERFTVLFSLGGEGIGPIQDYLEAYDRIGRHAQFIVICGRNDELLRSVREHFPDQPGCPTFRALGYQKNLRQAIAACDVIAGKAGTTSAMEAITLGKPLIVCRPGAPNEVDNMRHVVDAGYGWHQPRPGRFARFVESLADPADAAGQAALAAVRAALAARPRGNGARDLAEDVAAFLESGAAPN